MRLGRRRGQGRVRPRRSAANRKPAGVCGGPGPVLHNVDATLIRVLFVVMAVLGGSACCLTSRCGSASPTSRCGAVGPMGPADAQSIYGGRRALAVPDGGMECDRSCNTLEFDQADRPVTHTLRPVGCGDDFVTDQNLASPHNTCSSVSSARSTIVSSTWYSGCRWYSSSTVRSSVASRAWRSR